MPAISWHCPPNNYVEAQLLRCTTVTFQSNYTLRRTLYYRHIKLNQLAITVCLIAQYFVLAYTTTAENV